MMARVREAGNVDGDNLVSVTATLAAVVLPGQRSQSSRQLHQGLFWQALVDLVCRAGRR